MEANVFKRNQTPVQQKEKEKKNNQETQPNGYGKKVILEF